MRFGYARVSTREQQTDRQQDRRIEAGCDRLFVDHASGGQRNRPALDDMLDRLRSGDEVVVTKLDRLGRSLKQLIEVTELLASRDVAFISLGDNIDTTTPMGRLYFQIAGAFAEYERAIIRERTVDGLSAARARGRRGGRKPALDRAQVALIRKMDAERDENGERVHRVADIARAFRVSRQSVYRALEGERTATTKAQAA